MNKITVIGTFHSEGGACCSEELLKIIQRISPNVIFCEASVEKFPAMLKAITTFNTPEIKALRTIIEDQAIDVIPVDLNEDPFDGRLEAMHELFPKRISEYHFAAEIQFEEAHRQGFAFLNSEDCDQIHKDKNSMEKIFVAGTNSYELSKTYNDWLEWNDKRESHWIRVIHDYFERSKISSAVFLVGSAHRIRLMERLRNLQGVSMDNLSWDFYPFARP